MYKFIGIDISNLTFDVAYCREGRWTHQSFSNNLKGFKSLHALTTNEDWIIMEASGPYYLQLATYFYEQGIKVSVLNPLIIKRYSRANLYRAKTDKKDARTIAEYAAHFELKEWQPEQKVITHIKQIYTRIELLDKQIHQSQRQLEAFMATGSIDKSLKAEIRTNIRQLVRSKEKLEAQIEQIVVSEFKETFERLQTIPAIGKKTAVSIN